MSILGFLAGMIPGGKKADKKAAAAKGMPVEPTPGEELPAASAAALSEEQVKADAQHGEEAAAWSQDFNERYSANAQYQTEMVENKIKVEKGMAGYARFVAGSIRHEQGLAKKARNEGISYVQARRADGNKFQLQQSTAAKKAMELESKLSTARVAVAEKKSPETAIQVPAKTGKESHQ